MCYSAQIRQDFDRFVREYGAVIDIATFVRLYWDRREGTKVKTAKAMDATFARAHSAEGQQVRDWIEEYDRAEASKLEQEVFKQRKRLADAERILQTKTTKKALEDQRIATAKVEWALGKLADLRRTTLNDEDSRIFPGWYAPVIVSENGKRVVKPMRYQCRVAGTPAFYDVKFPGTYNARRDSLEKFWRGQFGVSHGILVVNAFYENVARHNVEHRELAPGEKEENLVLEFRPRPAHDMLVACLWSHWQGEGSELLSFAAITDEPPPEVAAAGHDRCIIPIKPEHVDAWLSPDPANLKALYAILDDRDRPYYEHRLAA
ncbi:SOS response-associated peptidase family protein [Lysobacter tyrosinilyticus]